MIEDVLIDVTLGAAEFIDVAGNDSKREFFILNLQQLETRGKVIQSALQFFRTFLDLAQQGQSRFSENTVHFLPQSFELFEARFGRHRTSRENCNEKRKEKIGFTHYNRVKTNKSEKIIP